jgi:SNF2 family DNA or RNA helicase
MEGSKRSQNRSRLSRMTESDVAGLPNIQRVARQFRYLFDEANPMASRTIILPSYSTWARRTFTPAEYVPSSLIVNENIIRSRIYRIYLDEGHLVKNISSFKHRATVTVETEYRWILTATPLINRKEDILGLLHILWREEWAQTPLEKGHDRVRDIWHLDRRRRLALNPAAVRRMLQTAIASESDDVDLVRLRQALPATMSQIQLRRIFKTPVIDRQRVLQHPQEEIPGYTIITVELRRSPEELREHHMFFHVLALEFEAKCCSYFRNSGRVRRG